MTALARSAPNLLSRSACQLLSGGNFDRLRLPRLRDRREMLRAEDGQEVTDDKEIVRTLLDALCVRVGRERYELWFGSQAQLSLQEGTLTIEASNPFVRDWLSNKFRPEVEAACRETLGQSISVVFDVARKATTIARKFDPGVGRAAAALRAPRIAPSTATSRETSTEAETPVPRRRLAELADFVVGPTNRMAHATATMVVERPGQFSSLVLHGPTGVGKTHLLEGILSGIRARDPRARAVYLTAEQFTTLFLEALRSSGLPSFRRKYRGVELLAIDDIQFFSGKKATLVELLHTAEAFAREGRQLVFAADRAPAELEGLGRDFTSRLAGGMQCAIEPPEYATRLEIARRMAKRIGVAATSDVLEYLATHLTSHVREISGALYRLQAASRAHAKPITLALAEEALSDLIQAPTRNVRLGDISRAVCDVFGIEERDLQSDSKSQAVSHPRMLAMWLARKYTRAPLTEIGEYFGKRTHSTVISAQKKVDAWVAKGGNLGPAKSGPGVQDLLRQVEQQLRVG